MKNLFYNFQDNISTHFPRWPEIHLCTDRKIVRKNKMLIAVLETDWVLVVSNRRGGAEEGEGAPVKLWWISRGQSNRTQDAAVTVLELQSRQHNMRRNPFITIWFFPCSHSHSQPVLMINFVLTAKTRLSSCEARLGFSRTVGLTALPLQTPCWGRSACEASLL